MECPMQAINYVGMKYQIDPDKCVSAACVPRFAIPSPSTTWMSPKVVTPMLRVERHRRCGGGGRGSGLVAAVKAAQAGKKVILVEKPRCWAATPTMPTPFPPGVYQVA